MDGLLVIDKPIGPTSHDVVARVRRALGEHRIGHTGTLDPLATGVLPLVIGRATRLARFLAADHKRYEATIRLGRSTDTYDAQGQDAAVPYTGPLPTVEDIDRAARLFRGTFLQTPPRFSAKKIAGRRSYQIARSQAADTPEGAAAMTPKAVEVTVSRLDILGMEDGSLRLDVTCSAGFYVRSLAHDLGQRLGTGAHLTALRRTQSGAFGLDRAIPLSRVEDDPKAAIAALEPPADVVRALPWAELTGDGVARATHGAALSETHIGARGGSGGGGFVRLLDAAGHLVGIAETGKSPGLLHPCVVLV